MELIIKTAGAVDVTRSGATVSVNFQKLPPEMVHALLLHGIAAKVGDAAASATAIAGESHFGKPRKEVAKGDWSAWQQTQGAVDSIREIAQSAMDGVAETLYAGAWSQNRSGIRTVRLPDDVALAVKAAKADLLVLFKKVTGKGKLVEMATHEKIAPFFQVAGDGVAWDDNVVVSWVAKQKDEGKRDYVAEAQATLSVDLNDLAL